MSQPQYMNAAAPYYVTQPISTQPQGGSGKKKIVGFVIGGILLALLITVIALVVSGTFDSADDNWNKPGPSTGGGGGSPSSSRTSANALGIDVGGLNHKRMSIILLNTLGQPIRIRSLSAKVRLQGERIASASYGSLHMGSHERGVWTFGVDWSADLIDDVRGRSYARLQIDFQADIEGMGRQSITYDKRLPVV